MKPRSSVKFAVLSTLSLSLACSASGAGSGSSNHTTDATGATGATSNMGVDMPDLGSGGSAGSLNVNISGSSSGAKDPNDPRDVPVRSKTCDANGENCTCLRLALLGTLDSAATDKDSKPFIDWLNGNSDNSARVTMVSTKPTVDATFLQGYDILLVANVNTWTFSAEEKAAVETWVRESGGGIITLTGFISNDQTEPAATSQLIEFSGVKYNSTRTAQDGGAKPLYYKGGTTDMKKCLGWTGSYVAKDTTPINFLPQTGPLEKLTSNLSYVGAYIGYGVDTTDGVVVATDPMSGKNIAVAKEVDGKGRIFAFGDEWVIFANQWTPLGMYPDQSMNAQNVCWQAPDATTTAGFFHSVQTLYQTKQFWYDAINWVAPPSECNFTIQDPDVVK
jgi:hypothetical protein